METIISLKNEYIQNAKSLTTLRGRKHADKVLLESEEVILWAIKYNVSIDYIITSLDNVNHITGKIDYKIHVFKTSEGLMKKITDTNYPVPIIAVGQVRPPDQFKDFVLVLDDVKDFGNIGTIVRTASAFGINNILSTKYEFDLFQKKTIDASRGTVFKTRCDCFENPGKTIQYLRENNFQIVTTSPYGSEIQSLVNLTNKPIALVVGNETNGASGEIIDNSDLVIQIPMSENVESLNVGVAAGISVYELRLKQVIKMIENRIKSTLGRELNVASVLVCEALDRAMQKVSFMTSHQLVFLMVLKCDERMLKIDIQKQFGILENEFDGFTEPLLVNGLISKTSGCEYSITENGVETIGKLWTIVENTENAILNDFSNMEKEQLFKMLQRIQHNCFKLL